MATCAALAKRVTVQRDARVATRFSEAGSWDELAKALAGEGVTLERKGQGLLLIHDNKTMKLSQLGKQVRYAELNTRFNETYDRYLERTSAGAAATAEPRQPWQRPQELEPEKRPTPGNQPTDDDAQGERGPGTARPPERTGTRDETSRAAPKQRGLARRRRLSRRRGASTAEAQDAMPTRPMGGEFRRLRPRRRSPVREIGEVHGENGDGPPSMPPADRGLRHSVGRPPGRQWTPRIRITKSTRQSSGGRSVSKSRPGNGFLFVRGPIEAQTRVPEDINRLLEQAVAEVRNEHGLLDGIAVDLGDLFRHVSASQPLSTVTKMDIVLALHQMGLVPESHVEQAFDSLEAEKQDPLLPSLMPEEPDREDDREM